MKVINRLHTFLTRNSLSGVLPEIYLFNSYKVYSSSMHKAYSAVFSKKVLFWENKLEKMISVRNYLHQNQWKNSIDPKFLAHRVNF